MNFAIMFCVLRLIFYVCVVFSMQLNIEPNHTTLAGHGHEHDVVMASKLGMLGSIDSNTGSPDLGWDTDQFPMDVKNAALIMNVQLYRL